MSANFLHGVETIEIDSGPRPIRSVKTAVVGVIGTAPSGLLNKPVMVLGARDAAAFGPNLSGFTIPQALNAIFNQGAGIVIVINVLDPVRHATAVLAEATTFDAYSNALTLLHPSVSGVVVKNATGLATYVSGTDYTLNAVTGKIMRLAMGTIPAAASVKVDYSYADPTKVTAADIIGAVDIAGIRSGMQSLLDTYNLMGFFAKMIIAPGFCTQSSVSSAMIAIAGALRAIALIDAPIGTTVAQAIAGRGPSGVINFNTSSERAVLCYPYLKRYDAATNAEVLEPMSSSLAGVICAKDIDKGYWWSPSNTEIKGVTGTERAISAAINDPTSEANALNEVGITTQFNSFGSGLRSWGNRSAAWPAVSHPRNFINVRRTADVLQESVEYSMLQFIDMPISNALIDAIKGSVNAFIRTLIGRGALIDGRCVYDQTKNPPTELALGHLTFDIEFMPPTPAERITFESFINIDLLKTLGK